MINTWGMQHDPKYFENPEVFDPGHYLGVTRLAPELTAAVDYKARDYYGYRSGRRPCPGIHLAERNLLWGIAKLVWAFNIRLGKDEDRKVVEPDVDPYTGYSEGFLVCAHPFKCEIEARSENGRKTIPKEYEIAEKEVFSKYQ
jgi:cytochrome P450 family 619